MVVLFDVEFKLYLLWLGSSFEDEDIRSIGFSLILNQRFLKFIVEFKVASRKDLEDWVTIIFEEKQVIVGLIFSFDVGKALSSKKAFIVSLRLETLDQDALSKFQVRVEFLFWHSKDIYQTININLNKSLGHSMLPVNNIGKSFIFFCFFQFFWKKVYEICKRLDNQRICSLK
jgi:hypothetical protein